MKFGKCGLGGSSWKQRPTVSSTLRLPLWLQPSSADGVGKNDSQLACFRGQVTMSWVLCPLLSHSPSLACSPHGP